MPDTKYVPTEPHPGECGHCKTVVHSEATTCPSCRAFWGFENGMNRNELYHSSVSEFNMGLGYVLVMALFLIFAALGYPMMAVPFLFGLLISIKMIVGCLIMGYVNKRTATNPKSGGIDWWLK